MVITGRFPRGKRGLKFGSIAEGLKVAAYVGSLRNFSGKPIIDHYFAYKVKYGNKDLITLARVKESPTSNNFYLHDAYTLKDVDALAEQLSETKDGKTKKDKQSVTRDGGLQYYNHNVFTEKQHEQIENAANEALRQDVSSTPGASHQTASSTNYNIYRTDKIYKNDRELP